MAKVPNHVLWWLLGTVIYFSWYVFVIGLREDHVRAYIFLSLIFLFWKTGRKYLNGLTGMLLYIVAYDSLRVFPNYSFFEIHTEDVYNAEKFLFGIASNGTHITPNEYFAERTAVWMDIISGFAYLSWLPIPLAISIYLFIKNRKDMIIFVILLALTNLFGVMGYYLFPTAPPWYIEEYGFVIDFSIGGQTAGLGRFDEFFGYPVFENMFSKNSSIFAAIPSIHSADPFISFLALRLLKYKKLAAFMLFNSILIWVAVVYSGHHYMIDVLDGIFVAALAYVVYLWLANKEGIKDKIDKYAALIT